MITKLKPKGPMVSTVGTAPAGTPSPAAPNAVSAVQAAADAEVAPPEPPVEPTEEAPPADPTAPTEPPVAEDEPTEGDPKKALVSMPSDTITRLKKKERARGKALMLSELETDAKANGFESYEDMVSFAVKAKTKPAPTKPLARTAKPADAPVVPTYTEAQLRAANTRAAEAERQARKHTKALSVMRAETGLREAAVRAGVIDTEFALHLVRAKLKTATQKELASFDERAYFDGLKATRPALFQPEVRPTTTGHTAGGPSVKTPTVPKVNVEEKTVDARKLSPEEFRKRLALYGAKDPAIGYSH